MFHVKRDGSVYDLKVAGDEACDLRDLLYSIAYERRFSGKLAWTVLQHSIVMGRVARRKEWSKERVQFCYLHDIHEAIIRDVPTPFKREVGYEWYRMEHLVQKRVLDSLGVGYLAELNKDLECKMLDSCAAYCEARRMFPEGSDIVRSLFEETHVYYAKLWLQVFDEVKDLKMLDDKGEVLQMWIDEFEEVLKL